MARLITESRTSQALSSRARTSSQVALLHLHSVATSVSKERDEGKTIDVLKSSTYKQWPSTLVCNIDNKDNNNLLEVLFAHAH
jgi:hypothetical protein